MEQHFATLKLLDTDPNSKSTKTFNYAVLSTSNQIYARRSCLFKSQSNLVRQYSCEQIFNSDDNARKLDVPTVSHTDNNRYNTKCQTMESYSDFYKSSTWRFSKNNNILQAPKFIPDKASSEVEYDRAEKIKHGNEAKFSSCSLSANAHKGDADNKLLYVESMKAEHEDAAVEQINAKKTNGNRTYEEIKKKFRPLVLEKKYFMKKKRNTCLCTCATLCIIPIATVILSLLLNLNTYTVCNRAAMFTDANLELQRKIYGQQNAVSNIIKHLDLDVFYLKVVCLIGGTGVGKSYSIEIIRKNVPRESKILSYDVALDHPIDDETLKSLNSYDLFIVENLKMKHLDMFANIIDVISEVHKCLTVIAIFNVEDVNARLERRVDLIKSRNVILNVMTSKKLDFIIVPYEPLSDESLELCIEEAASDSGLMPTREQINEIKQGLVSSGSGCKGAYAKLQVIGRN